MDIFSFLKPNYKNHSHESIDKPVADFIPYLSHYTSDSIVTKNGDLMSFIKVPGFSFETADDDELENKKEGLNNLLKGMANSDFEIYFHTFRRKYSAFPEGDFEKGGFAEMLNKRWKQKHDPEHTFINEHFITIIRKAPGKLSFLSKAAAFLQGRKEDGRQKALQSAYSELSEIYDRILNTLSPYKAKLLAIKRVRNSNYSEPMEFLGYLVNLGQKQKILLPRKSIDRYLPNTRIFFGDRIIEVVGSGYRKFAGVVSIKEYRPATYAGMLDGFLQLPFEFIITQSFGFTDRITAISKMQLQQRRLVQSEDVAVSQIHEINEALDSAMSGVFAFGGHHLTATCLADTQRELDNATSQIIVEFANCGVAAVREKINMEAAYWAQLPGNSSYAVRTSTINTLNLAGYASLHNYPAGKIKNNFWGNAVTVLNTTSGTPYFFNFHARDVGHTFVVGPTGGGKTILLNFLCCQAQKFRPRTFFFDKDRGAEIFLKSINGRHIFIDPGRKCYLNPFILPDNGENRSFLGEFLKVLITSDGGTLTAEEMEIISAAVNGNYQLRPEDRTISNIAPFLGIDTPGSVASKLKVWYGDGAKAKVFDNETDMIDFSSGRVFGFEMGELLKDETILSPVLLYLFHRIQSSLDGTPTMLILDEAWALIDNPVFAPKLKDWLKVMRKLNAFIVFATQSVEDAAKSSISDTLVQQTSTQIFLPNLKATSAYKDVFMLSDREFDIVKRTDPSSRYILIKQDVDGVVAKLDLSGNQDIIDVLSARADTVILLDEIIEKVGPNAKEWLPLFLSRMAEES